MPQPNNPQKNKVSRLCPECDAEVELTVDEETGDREGRCPKCKLDVGAVLNRKRYAAASRKLDEEEEETKKGSKKKSSWL